jgi:hypothetical protein
MFALPAYVDFVFLFAICRLPLYDKTDIQYLCRS